MAQIVCPAFIPGGTTIARNIPATSASFVAPHRPTSPCRLFRTSDGTKQRSRSYNPWTQSQRQQQQQQQRLHMGLRAVENFDTSFDIDQHVETALVDQLASDAFTTEVAEQANSPSVEFSGVLFPPVPYSTGTPRGMPRHLERFADDPNYFIINVPPLIMFKAKCFRPARLCAIYKRVPPVPTEDPSIRTDATDHTDLSISAAVAQAKKLDQDEWAGLGPLIQESFHSKEPLDDDELDSMVV